MAGYDFVILNWATSVGAAGYNVLRSTVSGGPYLIIASNVTATTYKDAAVIFGVTYYYVITATASEGAQSGMSSEVSATPSNLIPLYAVNCGGSAVGSFAADAFFATGSPIPARPRLTPTRAVPAPPAVYQTERYSDSPCTTPTFSPIWLQATTTWCASFCGNLFLRFGPTCVQRADQWQSGVDQLRYLCGGGCRQTCAVVRQFTLPANASGQFVVVATNVVQNAQFNGIEILSSRHPALGWHEHHRAGRRRESDIVVADQLCGLDFADERPGSWQQRGLGRRARFADQPADDLPNDQSGVVAEFFRLRHP